MSTHDDDAERLRAKNLDDQDPIAPFRDGFMIPANANVGATQIHHPQLNDPCAYLCGNSLGLMHAKSREYVELELNRWSTLAVEAHFTPGGSGWINQLDAIHDLLADIVGAKPAETACMSTLTANLHLMMNAFYKPTTERYKILCEAKAFPSDQYAFASQVVQHQLDPKEAIIELSPRKGEYTLREEDILASIEEHGASIALVLFPGLQYYTGQWFPMQSITKAAQAKGCICGWDLAHAVGNVPLSLHDWNVDFAVWCSYKYLNAGPGAIGGLFVHEKWDLKKSPQLTGWWGHDLETRFQMPPVFARIPGAQGWQQSNPSVLAAAALQGSLEVFKEAGGMTALRTKSVSLTKYLESLLKRSKYHLEQNSGSKGFMIITSGDEKARGCQLSLLILGNIMVPLMQGLKSKGVICDERRPDVLRISPIPLYNTYEDCLRAALELETLLQKLYE